MFCKIWYILENAQCSLEKNVCSGVGGWCVLKMSFRSSWLVVLFKSSIFCWFSVKLFCSLLRVRYWSIQLLFLNCWFSLQFYQFLLHVSGGSVIRCIYVYTCHIFLRIDTFIIVKYSFLSLAMFLSYFKVYFVWYYYSYSSFPMASICIM